MATDALDPGPDGDYPYLDMALQPTKPYHEVHNGKRILIDPTATVADGRRVDQIKPAQDR